MNKRGIGWLFLFLPEVLFLTANCTNSCQINDKHLGEGGTQALVIYIVLKITGESRSILRN